MTMASQFFDMTSSSNFFGVVLFVLSSLVTSPSFVSISSQVLELWQFSFIRDWPEIWNSETAVWVLPDIWRPRQIRDTKFGTNVSNKSLMNAAKCQGYSVYRFWVIKGKPTGGVKLPPSSPTQIRVNVTISIFRTKQERFQSKTEKSEHHYWILHICIILGTKFQLKVTILIFWTKFALKRYFLSETCACVHGLYLLY